jgi:hypothetical protein
MKAITPLIAALALLVPATAMAAGHAGPKAGAHSSYTLTAIVPDGQSAAPAGFGGPVVVYDATVTPTRHGCGPARTVKAQETGDAISGGDTLHFVVKARHAGWCASSYRVVVSRHTTEFLSHDACASRSASDPALCASAHPSMTTSELVARMSFRVD